jgi:tetratricopeptide (TPR) repeat protein
MTVRLSSLLLLLCTLSGYAQIGTNTDSLKQVLESSNDFKIKAKSALALTTFYKRRHLDSSQMYLNLLSEFALKSHDRGLQGRALLAEANYLQNLALYHKSIVANQKAIQIFEEIGDNQGIGSGYNMLGITYKKNSGDNNKVA